MRLRTGGFTAVSPNYLIGCRAGRPGYVWNYDNARIVLLSDDISKEAVVDVVAVCMACEKTETALVKGISCQGRLGDSDFDKYFDK